MPLASSVPALTRGTPRLIMSQIAIFVLTSSPQRTARAMEDAMQITVDAWMTQLTIALVTTLTKPTHFKMPKAVRITPGAIVEKWTFGLRA